MRWARIVQSPVRCVVLCLSLQALAGCATLPAGRCTMTGARTAQAVAPVPADCSAEYGFRLGRSGKDRDPACPAARASAFRDGYEQGRAIYLARDRLNRVHSEIYKLQRDRADLERDRRDRQAVLAGAGVAAGVRVELLYEVHRIDARLSALGDRIEALEQQLGTRQAQLEHLTK
jgi:hypothetical protein